MGGEYAVHIGIALLHPGRDLLLSCHAAAKENLLGRVAALGVGQGPQVAEDPLLGMLPDGAGVHHDHIGPICLLADGIAALGQIPPELFGVRLILLAAVGLYIGLGGHPLSCPEGGDFVTESELVFQGFLGNNGGFCIHRVLPCILFHLIKYHIFRGFARRKSERVSSICSQTTPHFC